MVIEVAFGQDKIGFCKNEVGLYTHKVRPYCMIEEDIPVLVTDLINFAHLIQ